MSAALPERVVVLPFIGTAGTGRIDWRPQAEGVQKPVPQSFQHSRVSGSYSRRRAKATAHAKDDPE